MPELVVVSGPSCVGKSPLSKALRMFYPDIVAKLEPLVLMNSRAPRPGERDGVDYHFRARGFIQSLQSQSGFLVIESRSDLQAVNLTDVERILDRGKSPFFEGNPYVGKALISARELDAVEKMTVFVSPLAKEEIASLSAPQKQVDMENLITDVMRRKLLRRTQKHNGILSQVDLQEVEVRARSAYREMQDAWRFQHVLPNHDGEDSEHWDAFYYPIGDARQLLLSFVALLRKEPAPLAEKWDQKTLPI